MKSEDQKKMLLSDYGQIVSVYIQEDRKFFTVLSFTHSLSFFKNKSIWATSRENASSGIFDQVGFKPACSAT